MDAYSWLINKMFWTFFCIKTNMQLLWKYDKYDKYFTKWNHWADFFEIIFYVFFSLIFTNVKKLFYCIKIERHEITFKKYIFWNFSVNEITNLWASLSSFGKQLASESKMNTWPHSVHSFKAVSNLLIVWAFISINGWPLLDASFISERAATAFATT